MSEFKADVQGFSLTVTTPDVVVANNVDQLVSFIEERVKDYDVANYDGDSVKAKKDRTELNKATEQVKSVRQKIQALNPYGEVIEKLANAEKLIKSGSDALGNIVHAREAEEKQAKRGLIQSIWNEKKFVLFPLDKILNERWLNKTYKITDIQNEIDVITSRTYRDIKTLETMEDAEALKARYLTDLDLSATLEYAENLKKNRELAAIEKDGRAEREHEEKIAAQRKEIIEENDRYAHQTRAESMAALALDEEPNPLNEYVLSVKVTEAQLLGIKNFLTGQGVEYSCKKLEF